MASTHEPVFIVGCPRSGTTLLQALLSSASRLVVPPEDDFILRLRRIVPGHRTRRLNGRAIERLLDELYRPGEAFTHWELPRERLREHLAEASSRTLTEFIEAVHEAYLSDRPGKTRWGCKVPYFALHLRELSRVFPRAKFVHLVRDGRDTFLSMRDRTQRGATHFPASPMRAAWVWRRLVTTARRSGTALGLGYAEFRYEDLVSDCGRTLELICEFIGEPYCDEMVERYYDDLRRHQNNRMAVMDRYVKPAIDAANTRRWADEMTADEIYRFQAIASDTLVRSGYPLGAVASRVAVSTKAKANAVKSLYHLHDRIARGRTQL